MHSALFDFHTDRLVKAYQARRLMGDLTNGWYSPGSQSIRAYIDDIIRVSSRAIDQISWC